MSDTPRTDGAAFKQHDGMSRYDTRTGAPLKIVTANFARDLERELATSIGLHEQTQRILKETMAQASDALALLRELNDALAIPGWLQPRVDAVLDKAEEK